MNAAYTVYMIDQNEPSRPEPLTLEPRKLRAQLVALCRKAFGVRPKKSDFEVDGFYGDIRISNDDIIVFVSFFKEDRAAAFKELGLDITQQKI